MIAFVVFIFFAAEAVDLLVQLLVTVLGLSIGSIVFLFALAYHDLKKEAKAHLQTH
jgi:hypothetical protein